MDPSALTVRQAVFDLVAKHLGTPITLKRDAGEDGLVCAFYKKPILMRELHSLALRYRKTAGYPNTDDPASRRAMLLSNVGKMGCDGFNLPAGPPGRNIYGTCPGSVPGFPTLSPEQRDVALSPEAKVSGVNLPQWICSGCYALKGRYPELNLAVAVETRRQVAVQLIADGGFVEAMEWAILMGQYASMRMYRAMNRLGTFRRDMYAVPNPAFFRIHDSGDFFSAAYLRRWVEVAKRFQRPRVHKGFTLPAVSFWAPTRTWAIDRALGDGCPSNKDMTCLPSNMIVRPSALNFGDHAPRLGRGFGAGAAAGNVEVWSSIAAFPCPAYLPPEQGGGAEPDVRKGRQGQWVKGCCARSEGPRAASDRNDRRAPDGHGCRVCWLDHDTSVAYQEH